MSQGSVRRLGRERIEADRRAMLEIHTSRELSRQSKIRAWREDERTDGSPPRLTLPRARLVGRLKPE